MIEIQDTDKIFFLCERQKKCLLIFAYLWAFHMQREKGGWPTWVALSFNIAIKKPDARAPHERRLGVWSYPRGRGIILRCSFNYLYQWRVKEGNSDPSRGRVHRGGLYYCELRAPCLFDSFARTCTHNARRTTKRTQSPTPNKKRRRCHC